MIKHKIRTQGRIKQISSSNTTKKEVLIKNIS